MRSAALAAHAARDPRARSQTAGPARIRRPVPAGGGQRHLLRLVPGHRRMPAGEVGAPVSRHRTPERRRVRRGHGAGDPRRRRARRGRTAAVQPCLGGGLRAGLRPRIACRPRPELLRTTRALPLPLPGVGTMPACSSRPRTPSSGRSSPRCPTPRGATGSTLSPPAIFRHFGSRRRGARSAPSPTQRCTPAPPTSRPRRRCTTWLHLGTAERPARWTRRAAQRHGQQPQGATDADRAGDPAQSRSGARRRGGAQPSPLRAGRHPCAAGDRHQPAGIRVRRTDGRPEPVQRHRGLLHALPGSARRERRHPGRREPRCMDRARGNGIEGWQPLSWMGSTYRTASDPAVHFAYNVTAMMVGNLADLCLTARARSPSAAACVGRGATTSATVRSCRPRTRLRCSATPVRSGTSWRSRRGWRVMRRGRRSARSAPHSPRAPAHRARTPTWRRRSSRLCHCRSTATGGAV